MFIAPAYAQSSDENVIEEESLPEQYPLSEALEPLLSDRLFRNARIGIQVVNASTGEEVYAHQADEAYTPASVMKAVTSAVALQTLGPAYRFSTAVLADEELRVDESGVLNGTVYVWGGGDPTLVVEDLWRMARDLRLAGVQTIEGDLVFDDTHFDQQFSIAGWTKEEDITNGPSYFAPIGALTVNHNTTCVVVTPGVEAGMPAQVVLETPTELVEVVSEVNTGAPGARPWMTIEREVDAARGSMVLTLEGVIPLDEQTPWRYYRTVPNPSLHFADVFRKTLEAQGVRVTGRNLLGQAPDDGLRVLVSHRSDSLLNLLNTMNKSSSNIIAESVLKTMSAELGEPPGTTEGGVALIRNHLTALGIPSEEYTLVNGSGLSHDIQLRPPHVNAVILDMLADDLLVSEYLASLAVGGRDGTLRRRFTEDTEVGRIRGKTGSVNGVYCLAGIIEGGDGERYVFTFFVNDYGRSSRPVRRLQDQFGRAILELTPENDVQ